MQLQFKNQNFQVQPPSPHPPPPDTHTHNKKKAKRKERRKKVYTTEMKENKDLNVKAPKSQSKSLAKRQSSNPHNSVWRKSQINIHLQEGKSQYVFSHHHTHIICDKKQKECTNKSSRMHHLGLVGVSTKLFEKFQEKFY